MKKNHGADVHKAAYTAWEQQNRCMAWWDHQLIAHRTCVALHLLEQAVFNLLPSMLLSVFCSDCGLFQFCLQLRPQSHCMTASQRPTKEGWQTARQLSLTCDALGKLINHVF